MQTTPGIGEYLAQQRRLRGISVDDLCETTKIPRRNLERLEAGAFDLHPDGFARGFVRTVAVALGLDPDEAVMRLMQEPEADTAPAADGFGRVAVWTVAVVCVVGALVLAWGMFDSWPEREDEVEERPPLTYRPDAVGDLARERETDALTGAVAPAPPEAAAPSETQAPAQAPAPSETPAPTETPAPSAP